MRRHANLIAYGILLILSGVLIFLLTALSYPSLTFRELFSTHPFLSWGIPLIFVIIGWVLIEIEREKSKNDER